MTKGLHEVRITSVFFASFDCNCLFPILGFSNERLQQMFHYYSEISADDEDPTTDEEPFIGPTGLTVLCKDLEIGPENVCFPLFFCF